MANINISHDELEAAAAQLRVGVEEIEGQITQITAMIENLVANGYITAFESPHFAEAHTEVTASAAGLIHGLETVTRYLEATAQAYEATESSVSQQFNA
jgi:uncharacterized protein YukE